MGKITITEPHPTVVKNDYTHAGRGGAGNFFRAPVTTPSTGIPTEPLTAPATSGVFYSGRGGAGNAHRSQTRPVMSLEDEYARQAQQDQKPIGHVGRGGAGNVYGSGSRKASDASSQYSSSSSDSRRSGFLRRLTSRQ